MELVQKYLDKVQKIDGLYVLQYPKETSAQDLHEFHEVWTNLYPDEILIAIPEDMSIHKRNRYSFYMAMMLINMGKRITRFEWARGKVKLSQAPYLCLEATEEGMEPVLIRRWPYDDEEAEYFFITKEDMDSEDYMLAPDREM